MSGWIKIHRKILEWEWLTKPLTFRLFIHLLLKANITDNYWRGSLIPAGSLIAGRAKLAQECGMTEREVRTALTHLKTTNEVTIKTTKEYSIISITNWKNYQASDQQNANQRPTNDQPTTTLKEYKNIRIKEDKSIGDVSHKRETKPKGISFNNWLDELKKTDPEISPIACPDALADEAERIGLGHAYGTQWERFHDYWIAQTGQKAVKADWIATWRNWLRRDFTNGKN